ncbi:MAG: peptidylprolyl isomerase [bacterium]|nr:peptidylprolyl isomerase [bacterium]
MEEKMPLSAYVTFVLAIIVIGAGYYWWSARSVETVTEQKETPGTELIQASQSLKNFMHEITIETNKGKIVIETYDQDAPKAAKNFVDLASKSFYNGVIFHRVIKGFMIQGGDPTGTGRGGPGYSFEDELNPDTESYKAGYKRGVVAMANSGPDTNGSQFFIMHADYPLPNNYTIFGRVVSGMEVVDAIANTKVGGDDRPIEEIVMKKATVEKK